MYQPILLNLKNKKVLIVGGGNIAFRRAKTFLAGGAKVMIVATQYIPSFETIKKDQRLSCYTKAYEEKDLEGMDLVIAATNDVRLNEAIIKACNSKGIWCNSVTQNSEADFILPASFLRGALTIAVSTEGKSPALAKALIHELKEIYGHEWEEKLDLLGAIREQLVKTKKTDRQKMLTTIIHWDREDLKALLKALKEGKKDEY